MTQIATLRLIEVGPKRILAGHDFASEPPAVLVLRRDGDDYELHSIPIDQAHQQIRSFVSVNQSEANELVNAILETFPNSQPRQSK